MKKINTFIFTKDSIIIKIIGGFYLLVIPVFDLYFDLVQMFKIVT